MDGIVTLLDVCEQAVGRYHNDAAFALESAYEAMGTSLVQWKQTAQV